MKKNDLLQCGDSIFRVLEVKDSKAFVLDCCKKTIPAWIALSEIQSCTKITETALFKCIPIPLPDINTLDAKSRCIMNERFTMISGILPFVSDFQKRNQMIAAISRENGMCRQTIINYLCLYLAFQTKAALAPKPCICNTHLNHTQAKRM